jgi:hypothetical protein
MSVDAEAAERLWNQLVEQHMDAVWGIATTAGLEQVEAALVSQLTWLRMAQRWPTVRALARSKDPSVHPFEQPTDQVDEWILHTARSEVDAWVTEQERRERNAVYASGAVVRMAPGFSPADATGPPR